MSFLLKVDGYLSVDELHQALTSIGRDKFTEQQVRMFLLKVKLLSLRPEGYFSALQLILLFHNSRKPFLISLDSLQFRFG